MPRKRSSGDGALYFDKKKRIYKGVVDIGSWPDGRRRQKTVTSKSQAEARRKLEAVKAEMVKYNSPLDRTTTIDLWAERWLREVQRPNMKPNGLASYETITRTWIIPTLRGKKVASLKPSDVRLVVRAVLDADRSTATARKAYNVLSGMLEHARREGLTERNVAADVIPPEVRANERGALSTEHAFAVLETANTYIDGTRWSVSLLGGLRQSERLGARIESLDLDAGVLHVEWTLDEIRSEHGCAPTEAGWVCGKTRGASCPQARLVVPDGFDYIQLNGRLCLVRPKSGKPRTVPLPPAIIDRLRQYLADTAGTPNPYGLIWRNPTTGEPHLSGDDQQAWRDVLHAAGVISAEQTKAPKDRAEGTPPPPTTHWARHTTATVLMELGVDARIIGEMVGHVDTKTTRGYQHVSASAARGASDKIGEHFAAALTQSSSPE